MKYLSTLKGAALLLLLPIPAAGTSVDEIKLQPWYTPAAERLEDCVGRTDDYLMCRDAFMDNCPGEILSTCSMNQCKAAERDYWIERIETVRQQLVEKYEAADITRRDQFTYGNSSRLLDSFNTAHQEWSDFKEAECSRYVYELYKGGTIRTIEMLKCETSFNMARLKTYKMRLKEEL